MIAISMALIHQVCSTSVARVVRPRCVAAVPSRKLSTSITPPARASPESPKVLIGLSEQELQQLAADFGQEKYRGKQLHQLIYKRKVKEIEEFTNLPLAFRNDLQEAGWRVGRSPVYQSVTASDGTVKLLLKLDDNRLIETVGIPVEDKDHKGSVRLTACISSQVGCPLRCSFCATGKGGFSRNLQRHEIVEQVFAIEDIFNHRVSNIVFMGMGEPMLNMKSVLEAHRCLNKDVQIGQRMITISTVGVPNTIKRLASHKLQSTLAVRQQLVEPDLRAVVIEEFWHSLTSYLKFLNPKYRSGEIPCMRLHAPNQKLRETIVPSAKAYPLEAIMKDCRDYFLQTSRRVTFEYALLAGVNDAVEHAVELAKLLHEWGGGYHVNLIPFNPIEGSEYQRPYKKAVMAFVAALESHKITVSVRQTRGLDANAACGQLRNQFQKNPLLADSKSNQSESAVAVAC